MKEKIEISSQFVLDAHKAACSEWKARIEQELPDLFPKSVIGMVLCPLDYSWCTNLATGNPSTPDYKVRSDVRALVVSEKYLFRNPDSDNTYWHVNVVINNTVYRILYTFDYPGLAGAHNTKY